MAVQGTGNTRPDPNEQLFAEGENFLHRLSDGGKSAGNELGSGRRRSPLQGKRYGQATDQASVSKYAQLCVRSHPLLTMAERIPDNMPVTLQFDDPCELDPLTPTHLLMLRPASMPNVVFNDAHHLGRRRWLQDQYIVDLLWTR